MDVIPVHHITSDISATGCELETVRVATQADPARSQLKHQIFQGRPEDRKGIPESICLFWKYCDELSAEYGLIFKTHKLMTPTSQQQEFMKDLHVDHLGKGKIHEVS